MSSGASWRETPPEAGRMRPFSFPAVSSSRLDNGLGVRVVAMPRLPVVSVMLVLPGSESTVHGGQSGLAVLTGDALEGGTKRRDGYALAEALEGLGATLGVSTGWDATTVVLSCLADKVAEAIPLLAEVVLEPAFPEEEWLRARAQQLATIKQREMDPGSLASDAAASFYYAEGVAYGRPLMGTQDSLEAIGPSDSAAFSAAQYRPDGSGIVVVGDLEPREIDSMLSDVFGAWSGRADVGGSIRAEARSRTREIHIVHRPGAVQSEIRIGHVGVPRSSKDFFPLLLLNNVLGGTFTSRLNLNLREKHGFTYGVRSGFAFRRGAGPFTVSTSVGTEVTAAAVSETIMEIQGLVEGGPTEEEIEASIDYVAGIFPLRFETTGQVAGRIADLIVHDLANDHYHTYRDNIRAVDAQCAGEACRRAIRPDELSIVLVGDAEQIRAPLEALELGPVQVHEAP